MSFEETKSGQIVLKSRNATKRMARYVVDDNKAAAVLIVSFFLKHPTKFIVAGFLNTGAWIIALRHLDELKPFVGLFNPF